MNEVNGEQKQTADRLVALLGGFEMVVTKLDGAKEMVKVRVLSIRDLPKYAQFLQDPPRCIELFCNRPSGWVDELSTETAIEILEKGHELNSGFLARSQNATIAALAKITPELTQAREKLVASALTSIAPDSPPKAA